MNAINPQRILLLAPLSPGSGNAATAFRLADGLPQSSPINVDCISVDTPDVNSILLSRLIRHYDVVIALHA
jgi:hypothetical protein